MNQTELTKWPSGNGWTICSIAETAAELAASHGVCFSKEIDNLGEVLEAVFVDSVAGQVMLSWHDHPDYRSVDVDVDTSVARDDGLWALWVALKIDIRGLDWVNPYAKFPGYRDESSLRPVSNVAEPVRRLPELTAREGEVLRLVADGKPVSAIAGELRIARSTVTSHLARIYLKLGVHGKSGLADALVRHPDLARSA